MINKFSELGVAYQPKLSFARPKDFLKITRKIERLQKKRYLDEKQLWLGVYFKKEIQSPELPPVTLRFINDQLGYGVFADEDLKPMTFIGEYAGCVRKKTRADKKNSYCFQYCFISGESTRYTIDAREMGGITRFINHSATPNLISALATHENLSHIILYTSKWVRKGEQLTYDYGPDYWAKREKPISLE